MISPLQDSWWQSVLPNQDNRRGLHGYSDLLENITANENAPPIAARYTINGAIEEDILTVDIGHGLWYEGVDHLDERAVPAWQRMAENITREGVTKLPWGENTLSVDSPRLLERTWKKHDTPQISFGQVVDHIHTTTGVDRTVVEDRVEGFIDKGLFEREGETISLGHPVTYDEICDF